MSNRNCNMAIAESTVTAKGANGTNSVHLRGNRWAVATLPQQQLSANVQPAIQAEKLVSRHTHKRQ